MIKKLNETDGTFFVENMDGYSLASGPPSEQRLKADADLAKAKLDTANAKGGFFGKEKRAARKETRGAKKEVRVEDKKDRKAKEGATPLKKVGNFFQSHLHPVIKNPDGAGHVKIDAKGNTTPVAESNLAQLPVPSSLGTKLNLPPLVFDKSDLQGKTPSVIMDNGIAKIATNYLEKETVPVATENGIEVYKKSDVEEVKAGAMSTQTKVLIGLGAGLLVVGIIYLVKKSKKG